MMAWGGDHQAPGEAVLRRHLSRVWELPVLSERQELVSREQAPGQASEKALGEARE